VNGITRKTNSYWVKESYNMLYPTKNTDSLPLLVLKKDCFLYNNWIVQTIPVISKHIEAMASKVSKQ